MATDAVAGGKVHVNGERVKPAHNIRIGDRITLQIQGALGEFDVVGLPARRGSASEAQLQYAEPAASVQRRATLREQHRLANLSRPRPEGRPDKRDRRLLVKLQRDQE
jgi:ribosome-associated heat shock protein Hsp15